MRDKHTKVLKLNSNSHVYHIRIMEYKRKKRKDGKTDLIRGIIHGAFVAVYPIAENAFVKFGRSNFN